MIGRRDLIIGGACAAAAIAAFGLTPRKRISLLGAASLDSVAPAALGSWRSRDVTDLVAPRIEGSLAVRLYNQTLERIYTDAESAQEVMVLLAHGDTQSNELQLHRPEVCYPAFGFSLSSSRRTVLPLAAGALLPVRRLVADAPGRRENIVYWTRLGEFLPTSANEQRLDRIKTAIDGYIADGLLARFSVVGEDSAVALAAAEDFALRLVRAVDRGRRAALVGTRLALAMQRGGSEPAGSGGSRTRAVR